jgi:hypothetical protein
MARALSSLKIVPGKKSAGQGGIHHAQAFGSSVIDGEALLKAHPRPASDFRARAPAAKAIARCKIKRADFDAGGFSRDRAGGHRKPQ